MSFVESYYAKFKAAKERSDAKAWDVVDNAIDMGVLNMRMGGPSDRQELFDEWSDRMESESARSATSSVDDPFYGEAPPFEEGDGSDDGVPFFGEGEWETTVEGLKKKHEFLQTLVARAAGENHESMMKELLALHEKDHCVPDGTGGWNYYFKGEKPDTPDTEANPNDGAQAKDQTAIAADAKIEASPSGWYKSRSVKMINGVCGGIAEKTGTSVLFIRLGFVFLTVLGVLVYIALSVNLPEEPAS